MENVNVLHILSYCEAEKLLEQVYSIVKDSNADLGGLF